jgi:hypothetical protein
MTIQRYFEAHGEEREAYLGSLSPDELLRLGVDLYNAGHYWNAHEAWEEVWLESERDLRLFYQGLIQVTAAFVHVTRDEYPGAVRLLEAGLDKLDRYPASFLGVELSPLRVGARRCLEALLSLGDKRIAEFDRALIPKIDFTP